MIKNIKTIESLVTELLRKHPHLRDSDRKLVATVWWRKLGEMIEFLNGQDVLKMYADGDLPDADSITRCRRKLQEVNESLRGTKWESRQKRQRNVINELKEIAA